MAATAVNVVSSGYKLILFVNLYGLRTFFSLLFWLWHRIRSKLTVILL